MYVSRRDELYAYTSVSDGTLLRYSDNDNHNVFNYSVHLYRRFFVPKMLQWLQVYASVAKVYCCVRKATKHILTLFNLIKNYI
jgi:hypothetical protein